MDLKNLGTSTKCIYTSFHDETGGAVMPVYNSTANSFNPDSGLVYYPRYLNMPSHSVLAEKMSAIENGEDALILSSGMAAITASFFALLKPGDHVIFCPYLYGGTHYLISSEFQKYGIDASFAASNKIEDFEKEIRENTRMIYIETPSNPLLSIIDIKAVGDLAKKHNLLTAIDNTFASPINQNPINLGIDIVIHSATKYLNGHSDLICGAIVSTKEIINKIKPYAVNHGAILNGQSYFLLDRGLKTLTVRVKQHNENAQALAEFLDNHKMINKVYYPGLKSHQDHDIAKKQMAGFGGMLSFELNCDKPTSKKVTSRLKLVLPAGSLGGVESLLCYPAETSHVKMSPEEREKADIRDNLVRFSVGIEDIQDLINDFSQALDI